MREFNPLLWFGKRKLDYVPKHFVRANTPVTQNSIEWIETKLTGRYSIVLDHSEQQINSFVFSNVEYVYFEDPKERTIYELYWAGN